MFLQPDWWEVMQAGVGTNRYSYSFNDPVNGKDPSGHYSFKDFFHDIGSSFKDSFKALGDAISGNVNRINNSGMPNSDGSYGVVHAGGVTVGCFGCRGTGAKAIESVGRAAKYMQQVAARAGVGGTYMGPIPSGTTLLFKNWNYLSGNLGLRSVAQTLEFGVLALGLLEIANYKGSIVSMEETGGAITLNLATGKWSFDLTNDLAATRNQIELSVPRAPAGSMSIVIHTHPASGLPPHFDGQVPSPTDLAGKFPGFVVTRTHGIYGYYDGAYQ